MTATKWRGKWAADFYLPDGTRVRRISPVQTKRGAEEYERELRASLTSTPSSGGGEAKQATKFKEFAVEWLTAYAAVNNKPSEVIAKEAALRAHLIPFFDNYHLHDFALRDIERYKAAKLKDGGEGRPLSPKTINNHLMVLRKLLATAVEWELLDKVIPIRRLKVPPAKFDWLTAEESERFLAAIEEHYPQWKAHFYVALRTGMRRGEIFALSWSDVDFGARLITVRHTVFRGKLYPPKGGRDRVIPMTARLSAVLAERKKTQGDKAKFLFPGENGELSNHQDHIDRPLHGALKKAGLRRIRFHDLRHSFASQLVSAGRSIKEVQELLGHTTVQVTMRYAHLAPGRMRDAVDVLDGPPQPDGAA
jgi:integrase